LSVRGAPARGAVAFVLWWLGSVAGVSAQDSGQAEQTALHRAAETAGVPFTALVPLPADLTPAPSEGPQPPVLLRALQAAPLQADLWARSLQASFVSTSGQAVPLWEAAAGLHRAGTVAPVARAVATEEEGDPLAMALRRLSDLGHAARPAGSQLPPDTPLTRPLRMAVADMLFAIADAEVVRRQALARVPASVTPELLVALWRGTGTPEQDVVLRAALAAVDMHELLAGMHRLVGAASRLRQALPAAAASAAVDWRWSTPLGEVRIDTTGTAGQHRLEDPLLIVDVGGDDHYALAARAETNRIAVLLDVGGNDRYVALQDGSDVAAGLLGYALLWDTDGDDRYQGGWLAQGAALLGAALLLDASGHDRYQSTGMAQGFAWGGVALLADLGGDDGYDAASYAQASAGPNAVAVLFDAGGNDRYALQATPVVLRSSQLPDRNTSMGQGVGRGLRAHGQAPDLAGGLGMLLDLAGNDHYSAQVFAQGAGYYFGVGLLIDGGGEDRFDAAWYAMGAAAHAAAGLLLKQGQGSDHYMASHSTSIGAAHDGSLAYFRDDGGDDHYTLGNLGVGAAQDGSVAVFVDGGGDDAYATGGAPCHAFGLARNSPEGSALPPGVGLGLFLDLGGRDRHPPHCPVVGNATAWRSDDGQVPYPHGAGPTQAGVWAGVDWERSVAPE
jgi:hypothetical protein